MKSENKILELENNIAELKDKVDLLIKVVTTNDSMSELALESGFNSNTINHIYDIMEKFYNQPPTSYDCNTIEKEFKSINISYQTIKCIFNIFYNENQYLSVLIRYLESLKENLKSIPTEYQKMYADLVGTK